MTYTCYYNSPLGRLLLACDEIGMTGVWYDAQKYFAQGLPVQYEEQPQNPILCTAREWLDSYFSGDLPVITPPLHLLGTDFQQEVWQILCTIPYGTTIIYGDIARQIAKQRGKKSMSAQAVGGAVGHNPIGIIVPCHRVIGSKGEITGYAGGIDKKEYLLNLERKYK